MRLQSQQPCHIGYTSSRLKTDIQDSVWTAYCLETLGAAGMGLDVDANERGVFNDTCVPKWRL